jgi:signal transduction histidine kinase
MLSEAHFGVRRTYDRIDTRTVLVLYAAVAVVAGLSVTGTGVRGIPGMPQQYASIIWITGMAIVAAGCAAAGLALNEEPVARRLSVFYFATGHVLLGLMVWMQWGVYWEGQGLPLPVALAPLAAGIVLFLAAIPVSAPGAGEPSVARRIRSSYDEHIQQIARREERARLARDLHDAVKQQLFVIQTAAATAQARFDDDPPGAREALTHVRSAAREATTEMEALLDELQAAPMENTGLIEALKKQCDALALRTGADVRFDPGQLPVRGLRPGAHDAIYRVAQEALANVARHARATRVTVVPRTDLRQFELRIADNGQGLDATTRKKGMGISNMETRAAEIGGRVSVTSGSSGTEVVLSVPLADPAVRRAWSTAAVWALVVLSYVVFYAVRARVPERGATLFALSAGIWVVWAFVAAYWPRWRQRLR